MNRTTWNIQRDGRAWQRGEAFERYELAPERIEMIGGKLFWSDEQRIAMVALLLENVGIDQAVRLGDPDLWKAAVSELGA